MVDLIANARSRHARSGSSEVMQEVGALLDALDAEQARAARQQAAAEQYLCDCRTYRRQLAERDATIAALQADLAMLKRPRRAAPIVGAINDDVVTTKQPLEK